MAITSEPPVTDTTAVRAKARPQIGFLASAVMRSLSAATCASVPKFMAVGADEQRLL